MVVYHFAFLPSGRGSSHFDIGYFVDYAGEAFYRLCNTEFRTVEWRKVGEEDMKVTSKKWIQGAIKHPGRCTPITKKGCTGAAKALALRFKKGGDLHRGK